MTQMIRVTIADDHPIFRHGVRRLIDDEGDMCVVADVADGAQVLDTVKSKKCDVLVLDLSLPNRSGLALLEDLGREAPLVRTVVLSMYPEDQLALSLMHHGALAFLNKERDPEELLEAIRRASKGKRYFTQTLSELAFTEKDQSDELPHRKLTAREYQVFTLLIQGKAAGEIAQELGTTTSTAGNHIAAIKRKLGAKSVAEVMRYASRVGLL